MGNHVSIIWHDKCGERYTKSVYYTHLGYSHTVIQKENNLKWIEMKEFSSHQCCSS